MQLPNDIFCRAAVYPRCLSPSKHVDDASLLKFSGKGLSTRSMSLASLYLCRDENGVHNFGEKIAVAGNNRKTQNGVNVSDDQLDRYLGFYSFKFDSFRKISCDMISTSLYWKMENGDERHFQVDLFYVLKKVYERVDAGIAVERATAEASGRKFKEPNRDKRAAKLVDADVRVCRAQFYRVLSGPVSVPCCAGDVRLRLQDEFLPKLAEGVN